MYVWMDGWMDEWMDNCKCLVNLVTKTAMIVQHKLRHVSRLTVGIEPRTHCLGASTLPLSQLAPSSTSRGPVCILGLKLSKY